MERNATYKANKDPFSVETEKEEGFFEVVSNYSKIYQRKLINFLFEDLILVQDECWQRG